MATNLDHFAFVVGIDEYSSAQFNTLKGACGDAVRFYDWLMDENGGSLPQENVALFTRPQQPPAKNPDWSSLRRQLADWKELSGNMQRPIGKRLYLYLAGHGYNDPNHQNDVHLVIDIYDAKSADAFPGTGTGEWFRLRGLFDEILLVMDCCRDREISLNPTPLTVGDDAPVAGRDPTLIRILFSYGAEYGRKSREREIDGKIRGVFTTALIEGLQGAALDGKSHAITGTSLIRYLQSRVPELGVSQFSNEPPQRPDFYPEVFADGRDFVISTAGTPVPASKYTVQLSVELPVPYIKIRLFDPSSLDPISGRFLKEIPTEWDQLPTRWRADLPRGVYIVVWESDSREWHQDSIILDGDRNVFP